MWWDSCFCPVSFYHRHQKILACKPRAVLTGLILTEVFVRQLSRVEYRIESLQNPDITSALTVHHQIVREPLRCEVKWHNEAPGISEVPIADATARVTLMIGGKEGAFVIMQNPDGSSARPIAHDVVLLARAVEVIGEKLVADVLHIEAADAAIDTRSVTPIDGVEVGSAGVLKDPAYSFAWAVQDDVVKFTARVIVSHRRMPGRHWRIDRSCQFHLLFDRWCRLLSSLWDSWLLSRQSRRLPRPVGRARCGRACRLN
jgi:hypothetical protein